MFILLACNAGMSTSMLAMRMEKAAKAQGVDATVKAVPLAEIDEYIGDAAAVVLGPQVKFALDDVKAKTDKPVVSVDMKTYGTMNGEKVFADVMAMLGE